MSSKTEFSWNEDDFVQQGDTLNELTVTITLTEYRNLIEDRTRADINIAQLQEEKETLKKQLSDLVQAILSGKIYEYARTISDFFMHLSLESDATQEAGTDGTE